MLFQVPTALLAHPDPLLAGICHQIKPSWVTPGSSLGFRSAFPAVCSLPCHRDAMQPLHPAPCSVPKQKHCSPHWNSTQCFQSIKFSHLTALHNSMPTITWKFCLKCNYAILWPPFHQTLPFVTHFHSLVSVPQGRVCSISKQGIWGTGTLTDLEGDKNRGATPPALLCHMCSAVPLSHVWVLWN